MLMIRLRLQRPRSVLMVLAIGFVTLSMLSMTNFTSYTPQEFSIPVRQEINVLDHLEQQGNVTSYSFNVSGTDLHAHDRILDFDRQNLKVLYPEIINELYHRTDLATVDWSKLAYVLYATSTTHVCNVMIKITELRRFGSPATMVLLLNKDFLNETSNPHEYAQLIEFSNTHNVVLKPIDVISMEGHPVLTWAKSFTKLLVFNETDYDRVIYMDSDSLLPNGHLDELFFIPPCKLAVPNGYWLSRAWLEMTMKPHVELPKYEPIAYNFTPLTTQQRKDKIQTLIQTEISPFIDPESHKLRFSTSVNRKNFYTNLYNNLPNDPAVDEFKLTNIVMVIQPTREIFQRVETAFNERTINEFDMDLVQARVFPARGGLDRQLLSSFDIKQGTLAPELLDEVPELLVLPHQIYAVLTSELNYNDDHRSFISDTHDEPFAMQDTDSETSDAYYQIDNKGMPIGDIIFHQAKYVHFTDPPWPKPWYHTKLTDECQRDRLRCGEHPDWIAMDERVKPKGKVDDCTAGKHWEWIYKRFKELRLDVCHSDLIEVDVDPYE